MFSDLKVIAGGVGSMDFSTVDKWLSKNKDVSAIALKILQFV